MAKIRIQLRRNPATGKQDLLVDLHSDEELMQFEHERLHAQIVDDLVRRGVDAGQLGKLLIERGDVKASSESLGAKSLDAKSLDAESLGAESLDAELFDAESDHNEGCDAS